MDKVVVSNMEVAKIGDVTQEPKKLVPKLPPAIPWWGRAALSTLVIALPLLCIVAAILRISLESATPDEVCHGVVSDHAPGDQRTNHVGGFRDSGFYPTPAKLSAMQA